MTGKEMCEYISDYLYEQTGDRVPPEDVWNMDPNGELWPVFMLYEEIKGMRERASNPETAR